MNVQSNKIVGRWVVPVLLVLAVSNANAGAPACQALFKGKPAANKLVLDDPFQQWLKWEQESNLEIYRKSGDAITINAVAVPKGELVVDEVAHLDPELKAIFKLSSPSILWLKHPYNTATTVPFMDNEKTVATFTGYYTASRSLALFGTKNAYTVKMPTDHPHGPNGEFQGSKASTADDILSGMVRTRHVDRVDSQIGADDMLMLAREVLTVSEKTTHEGYLVRDVSFLKDGHYYLPAFSLPFAGREIAKQLGQDPNVLWKKYYGETLGRAKARLLLRYGLQMETPNPQNMLIQLDKDLKPTGKMVFRDMSDSFFVEPVARALGFDKELQRDRDIQYNPNQELNPYWSNSNWRLDEAGSDSYSKQVLQRWGVAHDTAYVNEIENALGIKIDVSGGHIIKKIQDALFSETGKRRLKEYRQKLMDAHGATSQGEKAG